MLKRIRIFTPSLSVLAIIPILAVSSPVARAGSVSYVDMYRNVSYEQTGNGPLLTLNGAFFTADINTNTASPYASASVSVPGGGSASLSQISPTQYEYQTSLLPSVSTMNSLYPTGTYTFSGTGSSSTDAATLQYSMDDYSATTPYLTGGTYSSLQGMNAAQAFDFELSQFTPGTNPDQTAAYIFLTVYNDTTNTVAFSDGFLSPSTTSILMPGGTLTAGDAYSYEIDYSDRDTVSGAGADFSPEIGFDTRTDGDFSTAVAPTPEPSTLALCSSALLLLASLAKSKALQ